MDPVAEGSRRLERSTALAKAPGPESLRTKYLKLGIDWCWYSHYLEEEVFMMTVRDGNDSALPALAGSSP